jgi:hypothetical protein
VSPEKKEHYRQPIFKYPENMKNSSLEKDERQGDSKEELNAGEFLQRFNGQTDIDLSNWNPAQLLKLQETLCKWMELCSKQLYSKLAQ